MRSMPKRVAPLSRSIKPELLRVARTMVRRLCAPFVGIGGYNAMLNATAEMRVRPACSALTPGMSVQEVTAILKAHGMYTPREGSTVYYIGEKATANGFGCLLRFKERVLQSATYSAGGRE